MESSEITLAGAREEYMTLKQFVSRGTFCFKLLPALSLSPSPPKYTHASEGTYSPGSARPAGLGAAWSCLPPDSGSGFFSSLGSYPALFGSPNF